jgi:hypothetical protein
MPKLWYLAGVVVVLLWAGAIYWLAGVVSWSGSWLGFAGTVLTLLPAILDLFRKFYVGRAQPSVPERADQQLFHEWIQQRVTTAFVSYEWLYALFYALGLSGIALGFARELHH